MKQQELFRQQKHVMQEFRKAIQPMLGAISDMVWETQTSTVRPGFIQRPFSMQISPGLSEGLVINLRSCYFAELFDSVHNTRISKDVQVPKEHIRDYFSKLERGFYPPSALLEPEELSEYIAGLVEKFHELRSEFIFYYEQYSKDYAAKYMEFLGGKND